MPNRHRSTLRAAMMAFAVFCVTAASCVAQAADEQQTPRWLRYPAVSPDGSRVAFSYGGQIWVVPADGGDALPLTSGLFYSKNPVWSPDGESVAFASTRYGNLDVFITPSKGGEIRRLTHYSKSEVPMCFSPDGTLVYFRSNRSADDKADFNHVLLYTSRPVYSVPVTGGRERLVVPTTAQQAKSSRDGRFLLYTNLPSIESEWRKHAVSDAACDIWVYDTQDQSHRQLTTYRGEDRYPAWGTDGNVYYLSERSGSFNIWRKSLRGRDEPVQVTFHETHPARFLTAANDGTLVYHYDGEIWKLPAGADKPQRVSVHISQGSMLSGTFLRQLNKEATGVAVAPSGKEFAIIARGEVFVVSGDGSRTRRITNTPQQERKVSFSPDGRSLLYSGERDGSWDLYETHLVRDDDELFSTAVELREEPLVANEHDNSRPAYSPDGTKVAYFEDRVKLTVIDRESKTITTADDGSASYSYQDGDITFDWSPDGNWLVMTNSAIGKPDVYLVDATGQQRRFNVTRTGEQEQLPQFAADGQAIVWLSSLHARKDARGSAANMDLYAAFLTKEAFDAFYGKPVSKDDAAKAEFDLDGLRHRTVRLSPMPLPIGGYYLTPDIGKVVVLTQSDTGAMTGYALNTRSHGLQQLFSISAAGVISTETDPAASNIYILRPGAIEKHPLAGGAAATIPFAAEVEYDMRGEMQYIFDHVHRWTKVKFYDVDMHGVDWDAYHKEYARYLPSIHRWEDFADMLGEMVGELNASHTAGQYLTKTTFGDETAGLGLIYDSSHEGAGVRVATVLPGGPADRVNSPMTPGAIILAVDGVSITPDMDIYELLNHKVDRPIRLSIQRADGGDPVEEVLTGVATNKPNVDASLMYQRWIDARKAMTKKLSGGRLGYVHVPAMDIPSYERVYSEALGQYADAEALIVDVRFNTGGNLHDQLVSFLTAQPAGSQNSRDGVLVSPVPKNRWVRPSLVIANAASYSDGSVFPDMYKKLGIGPLVGERVPGTGTAVWWEFQMGNNIRYGVPQLGFQDVNGEWLENQETVPDVLVVNTPDSIEDGKDLQLEAAVKTLLEQLDSK